MKRILTGFHPFEPDTIRMHLPVRQFRAAIHDLDIALVAANNYTVPFAKALLMAALPGQLKDPPQKKIEALSRNEMALMEKETEGLVNWSRNLCV